MNDNAMQSNPTEIVQEIQIAAPAARIFAALLDPEQRRRWWNREGRFAITHVSSDPRPGGLWRMEFTTPERRSSVEGAYRVIAPPHRLEFTWRPSWYEHASESVVRFDLEERSGVTTVRLTHSGLVTEADRANHRGWADILNMLRSDAERSGAATPSAAR